MRWLLGCVVLMGLGSTICGRQQCSADELLSAAQKNDVQRLKDLTALGIAADVIDEPNAEGFTALVGAAREGNIHAVDLLLKAGADVDAADSHKWTALGSAAHAGHDTVASILLHSGASADRPNGDSEWTALMAAAQEGHDYIISMLLQHGADVNARDSDGYTALHIATQAVQLDAARQLLQNGANPQLRTSGESSLLCSFVQLDRCRGKTASDIARAVGVYGKFNKVLNE